MARCASYFIMTLPDVVMLSSAGVCQSVCAPMQVSSVYVLVCNVHWRGHTCVVVGTRASCTNALIGWVIEMDGEA